MGRNDVVYHGRWVTNDHNKIIHFKSLGPNASMVWVTLAKEPLARLRRASMDADTVGEALDSSVAWPTDRIVAIDET
ncbi:hypothetical protein GIB67_002569 [Kingdonia uniflora]|uniref:Uncharacterized protein n=1 Tax=Kingdonia uniflora TaxID=39325 RepID=A0A7J7N3S9_9MAGN|nr:hypothetical protein GIB67_002569 [Kingdonia uniflora]